MEINGRTDESWKQYMSEQADLQTRLLRDIERHTNTVAVLAVIYAILVAVAVLFTLLGRAM